MVNYLIISERGINILKENQFINIRWNSANKKRFIDKGYTFTKINDYFLVNVNDLSESSTEQIVAICDYCNKEYPTSYCSYMNGIKKNGKSCCANCHGIKISELSLERRRKKLYSTATSICNEAGYDLLTKENEFTNRRQYITYICPKHGKTEQILASMIAGHRCPKCGNDNNGNRCRLSKEELIEAYSSFGCELLNPDEYINAHIKNLRVLCNCKKKIFKSSWHLLTKGVTQCRSCSSRISKGEKVIEDILNKYNIKHEREYRFKDCRDKRPLPFDFYFESDNTCIEYDGEQHFMKWHSDDDLKDVQRRDNIKTEYCKKNNIRLIRIPYWEKGNIEEILKKENIIR